MCFKILLLEAVLKEHFHMAALPVKLVAIDAEARRANCTDDTIEVVLVLSSDDRLEG
jgi:hypothetical protein